MNIDGLLVTIKPTSRMHGIVTRMLEGWGFDTVDGDLVYLKRSPTAAYIQFALLESQISSILTIVGLSTEQTSHYLRRRDGEGKEKDSKTS